MSHSKLTPLICMIMLKIHPQSKTTWYRMKPSPSQCELQGRPAALRPGFAISDDVKRSEKG